MEIKASLLVKLCSLIRIGGSEIKYNYITNQEEDHAISIGGSVIIFKTDENDWYIPANEIITLDEKGKGHINLYMDYHEQVKSDMQRQLLPIRAYVVSPLSESHIIRHTLGLKN